MYYAIRIGKLYLGDITLTYDKPDTDFIDNIKFVSNYIDIDDRCLYSEYDQCIRMAEEISKILNISYFDIAIERLEEK